MVSALFLTTAVWCGLLSHRECEVRDCASVVLSVLGDREAVKTLSKESECPEARSRAFDIFRALTIRDLDYLAGSSYPRADLIRGWQSNPRNYVPVPDNAWLAWNENNPEFYEAEFRHMTQDEIDQESQKDSWTHTIIAFLTGGDFYGYGGEYKDYIVRATDEEQRAQTRRQLAKYLVRTSDWGKARNILSETPK